jgi:hypothetical protein
MTKDTPPRTNFYNPGSEGHHQHRDSFYIDDESHLAPEPQSQAQPSRPSLKETPKTPVIPKTESNDYLAQLSSADAIPVPPAEMRPIPNPDKVGAFQWTKEGTFEPIPLKEAGGKPEYASDLRKDNDTQFIYHEPTKKVESVKPLADAFMHVMDEADAENAIARDLKRLKEGIIDTDFMDSSGQKHTKSEVENAIDQVYNSIQKKNIAQAELFLRQIPRGYGIREKVRKMTGLQKHQEDIARALLEEAYQAVPKKAA